MTNPIHDRLFAPLQTRSYTLILTGAGSTISGQAFYALIAQLGQALRAAGVTPGDRVAAQVAKSPQALALYAASVSIGAVFLPLNTAYTSVEVDYFIANATPAVFVCDPAKADSMGPVASRYGAKILTMGSDGGGGLSDLAKKMGADFTPSPRAQGDLAAILYTSGTTGRSKGAMLSHDNLLSNALVLADQWMFSADDVLLHALPIFHTHGLFVASNIVFATGGKMIFLPGFDADQVIRMLPQATAMMGVPTFYTRLLDDARLDRDLVAHMRLFVSGSAPLLAETHVQWQARTGHRILERYGMTETNMNTSNPCEGERRAGTVGHPLPGVELRIMADGEMVAPGAIGVIEVRGPNVFQGYWQMPEKTAEELRADGWFITGDVGRVDSEGYVQIVGRAKDLVITGGYNVYPVEVEAELDAVPGVLESAVIGLPHPDLGEAVFAVLVAAPGLTLNPAAVLDAVRDRLARFKQPRDAVVVAALPRNTMAKVQKAEMRKTYAGWFGKLPRV